ncbi:MAG TPA: hypothetical protein VII43_00060, partial [Opitutaceae bacterium]
MTLSAPLVAAEKPLFAYQRLWVANGCFVESVACYDAFHEAFGGEGWARVLQWGSREDEVMVAGHAVAVFESDGVLWCWDVNHGWMRLSVPADERDDAAAVSAPVVANYPRLTAVYPMMAEDGAQAPAAGPPGAEPDAGDEGSRDASQAALRLARHRPVNLIEVTQVQDGVTRTSEAVVFAFGGRMCLYAPASGTTTFRTRSSVWNVRLILEMARRVFPG